MRAGLLLVLAGWALAGCDKLLGLQPLSGPGGPRRWQAVAVGGMHTCALEDDGSLWCWGDNTQAQIGLGLPLELDEPTRVGTASWAQIAAGEAHTCAIQSDASLWCWGRNDEGQTGTGGHGVQTTNVRLAIVQTTVSYETGSPTLVEGSWRTVATGYAFTCGIQLDGSLWCWGDDQFGQLADPAFGVTRPAPRPVGPPGMQVTSVATGAFHACAVSTDGSLWCWGLDDVGQLGPTTAKSPSDIVQVPGAWTSVSAGGRSTCAVSAAGELQCWGAIVGTSAPTTILAGGAPLDDIAELEVGGSDTPTRLPTTTVCARRGDGTTWCVGDSLLGQLGPSGGQLGGVDAHAWAQGTWAHIAVGPRHSCALASDASLWCVGSDARGQLGDGGTGHHAPAPVVGMWATIAGGLITTCVRDAGGLVSCAGQGARGALGTGDERDRRELTAVAGTLATSVVVPGTGYACAIAAGPQLWCWGENREGELGDNNASGLYAKQPVPSSSLQAVAVAASQHTCAIDPSKQLYCWGLGTYGELGTGEPVSAAPSLVTKATAVDEVVVGAHHTCERSGNAIYCFGRNDNGECGAGIEVGSLPDPTRVAWPPNMPDPASLASGARHTCALDTAGRAYCWGYNAVGQLGVEGLGNAPVPTPLGPRTWLALTAGSLHTCGIASDGSLWCWGDNDFGQLGDGTLTSRDAPTRIADGGRTWTAVTAGGFHTCAIASDGSTWCWGNNDFGQLATGDGWRDNLVPVGVP